VKNKTSNRWGVSIWDISALYAQLLVAGSWSVAKAIASFHDWPSWVTSCRIGEGRCNEGLIQERNKPVCVFDTL